MQPILDSNGRLVPREDYRITTLNCGEEDFAIACMRANLRYNKNRKRDDVKSHHYIISFDPRDGADNGLTVDRAQKLGEQFCKEHFPGHQALVCTHPDGHNHSGNIHVHIVINSLKIEDVPLLAYMDRPADTKAGMKHRCTDAAMEYFKAEVMEMCQSEGLYQIDLLHGSENRITEREYWAKRKGQAALDKENAVLAAKGQPIRTTKFETDKERLRQIIQKALATATSFDEFAEILLQQGVTVKESRRRLSYLTSDRTKSITARRLGEAFDRAAIFAALEQNAGKAVTHSTITSEFPPSALPHVTVQRMVDIDAKRAEGKGIGYEKWAALHNVKQIAATLKAYQEYGFASLEELEAALSAAYGDMRSSTERLKKAENLLRDKKQLQRHVLTFRKAKPVLEEMKAQKSQKNRDAYRREHESDFIRADAAMQYFKEHGITKLPSSRKLQAEVEQLVAEKNVEYNDYRDKKQRYQELITIKTNFESIQSQEHSRRKQLGYER